ncbi:hypothetical protein BC938DRAFT_482076 [Jimgerdemannia flammicorona]|uniref:F-box domain-containing protein n=1 Tax=Jimgerdemannia flammicorona TaxID=994334 RepID=A0A433QEW7_9FUNG|nr:hypothetical protein BC938DRAFT_482076 [Jimgerdemannia flammicorona]
MSMPPKCSSECGNCFIKLLPNEILTDIVDMMQCSTPIKLSAFAYPFELVTVNRRFAAIAAPILWRKVKWQQVRRILRRTKRHLPYQNFIRDITIEKLTGLPMMELAVEEIRAICPNVAAFRLTWELLSNKDVGHIIRRLGSSLKELKLDFELDWEMTPINSQTIVQILKESPNLEVLSLNWVELDDQSLLSALENYPGHQKLKDLTLVACPPGWQSASLRLSGGQITARGLEALYRACNTIVRFQASSDFAAHTEILQCAIVPHLQRLIEFRIYTTKGENRRFARQHNTQSGYANPWDIWQLTQGDIFDAVRKLPRLIRFRVFDRDYAATGGLLVSRGELSRRMANAWGDNECPLDLRNFAFVHLKIDEGMWILKQTNGFVNVC